MQSHSCNTQPLLFSGCDLRVVLQLLQAVLLYLLSHLRFVVYVQTAGSHIVTNARARTANREDNTGAGRVHQDPSALLHRWHQRGYALLWLIGLYGQEYHPLLQTASLLGLGWHSALLPPAAAAAAVSRYQPLDCYFE